MRKLRIFLDSLDPARTAKQILLFNAVVLALVILVPENPAAAMKEGGIVTWISFLQLLAAAFVCYRLYEVRARHQKVRDGWLWLLIAAGFAYLAADEAFQIHENLDELIHWALGMQRTAATDRIDDYIIALYGLAGLGVLWIYRRELLRFRAYLPLFGAGFAFLFLTVVFDMLSNDRTVTDMLTSNPQTSRHLQHWLEAIEESAKVLGEAIFLISFLFCLKTAESLPPGASPTGENERPKRGLKKGLK